MGCLERSLELRKKIRTFILGWFNPAVLAEESSRETLNNTLKQHWPNDPIQLYELVYEHWEPKPPNAATATATPTGHFVVFIDIEIDVDWIYDGHLESKSAECVSRAEAIGARRCQHLPREQVLEFKRLIGQ